MKSSVQSDIADPFLFRLYWGLMLSDVLYKLGFTPTKANKEKLHDFHKRVLGYETISGRSQEVVSRFLFEVSVFWSVEMGMFIRTSSKQPYDIEHRPLSEVWKLL